MADENKEQASGRKSYPVLPEFYRLSENYKEMVRSIGLRKLNQIVERPDDASMRGVVAKVPHLLRIVE